MPERITLGSFFGVSRPKDADRGPTAAELAEVKEAKAQRLKAKADAETTEHARRLTSQLTEVRDAIGTDVPDDVRRAEQRLDTARPDTDQHRDASHHFLNLLNLAARSSTKPSWMTPELERRGRDAAVAWERTHRPDTRR